MPCMPRHRGLQGPHSPSRAPALLTGPSLQSGPASSTAPDRHPPRETDSLAPGNTNARGPGSHTVTAGVEAAGSLEAAYRFLRFFFLFSFSRLRRSLMASRSSGLATAEGGA